MTDLLLCTSINVKTTNIDWLGGILTHVFDNHRTPFLDEELETDWNIFSFCLCTIIFKL